MRNTVTTGKEILSEKSKKGCQNIRYQKIMRTPNRIRSSHYSRLAQRINVYLNCFPLRSV